MKHSIISIKRVLRATRRVQVYVAKSDARWFIAGLAVQVCTMMASATSFNLLTTQSPPGPQNQNPDNWQGVLQYHVLSSGAELNPQEGVPRDAVADPAGLAFRAISHEVFVGNRHGNNQASSITRFRYDFVTRALIPNGQITGNGLYGVHQVIFNPHTGELFAANVNNGVSRFTFDAEDNPVANGTIANGSTRGVAISPNGARLYVTTGTGSAIRSFDLVTGIEQPAVNVPTGVGGLHNMRVHTGILYVAGVYDDRLYRYHIDAQNDLQLIDYLEMNDPISIDFSPDGSEMFVTGHRTSDLIYRFLWNSTTESWTEMPAFDANSSLGDILVIPDAPSLEIQRDNDPTQVMLTWPVSAADWTLETTSALEGLILWTEVNITRLTNAATIQVTMPHADEKEFYRLRAPW